jgi:transposase InsO family protein
MGMPERVQIDNALFFLGSPTHPTRMGPLIRFCLHYGVEPWFIPIAEPWKNEMIENFNNWCQQNFFRNIHMASIGDLQLSSLAITTLFFS